MGSSSLLSIFYPSHMRLLHLTQYSAIRTQYYYYLLGLLLVNPTNWLPTIHQLLPSPCSLKMVSAICSKELQNVLPKGNPLSLHIEYASRRDEAGLIRFQGFSPRILTSTDMSNEHKTGLVLVPPVPLVLHFVRL